MTDTPSDKPKSPLARLLFEHDVTDAEAACLLGTSTAMLNYVKNGKRKPRGAFRDRLARLLIGEISIAELRARAAGPGPGASTDGGPGIGRRRTDPGEAANPASSGSF